MVRLEQLTPGAFVRGLVPGTTVKIVQVERFGDQAVKVTFEEPTGAVRNRLLYRLAGSGRAWSFQGGRYLFCLASEAKPRLASPNRQDAPLERTARRRPRAALIGCAAFEDRYG